MLEAKINPNALNNLIEHPAIFRTRNIAATVKAEKTTKQGKAPIPSRSWRPEYVFLTGLGAEARARPVFFQATRLQSLP